MVFSWMGTYVQEKTSGSCGILSFTTDLSGSRVYEQQRVWDIGHSLDSQGPHHILRIQGQDAHLHKMTSNKGSCFFPPRVSQDPLIECALQGVTMLCRAQWSEGMIAQRPLHRRVVRPNGQESRSLVAFRDRSHINAGDAARNLLLLHLQQLPCLGELKVDDLTTGQGEDDLHIAEVFDKLI